MVIATINGGKYLSATLKALAKELKPIINHIINQPEYSTIVEYVRKTYTENIEGKTISRILQVEENKLLELYVDFFYTKGLIKPEQDGFAISLIFDGFQLLANGLITDELLEECREFAKTMIYHSRLNHLITNLNYLIIMLIVMMTYHH